MRSITSRSSIRETIRISFWHRGQRSGSASQIFLMSSRHLGDGMRRGLWSETSMTASALPVALAVSPACLLRWPRILLEYQP